VWNARLRKSWLWGKLKVAVIGEAVDLTYPYEHIGTSPDALLSAAVAEFFKGAKRPMVIVGEAALCRATARRSSAAASKLAQDTGAVAEGWAGYGVLHTAAGRVGALDVGFLPAEGGKATADILGGGLKTVVLLGADEVDLSRSSARRRSSMSARTAMPAQLARRYRSALCGVYRNVGDLRQHRRPRADDHAGCAAERAKPARAGPFSARSRA
jgi:NADH dehydrogenase/NADH:ubiquinone oxidoreductase subunit G